MCFVRRSSRRVWRAAPEWTRRLRGLRSGRISGLELERRVADLGPVDQELEVTLVRITQEALANVDLDDYVLGAVRAGASGFLLKDQAPDVLASAIRTVTRGEAIVAPPGFGCTSRLQIAVWVYEHGIVRVGEDAPGRLGSG